MRVDHAGAVIQALEARPATLGTARLLCIDGLAGSGKSTLAAAIGRLRPDAVVLATDEMLAGWRGLPGLAGTLDDLLRPLAAGSAGGWRRWDWHAGRWAERRRVEPVDLLVLEGVGSAAAAIDDLVTLRVWLEAAEEVRRARWRVRDGAAMLAHWPTWQADEAALHARDRTRERADLCIDTTPPEGAGGPDADGR